MNIENERLLVTTENGPDRQLKLEKNAKISSIRAGEKFQDMKFQAINVSDWRQAIRSPPSYRIGNGSVRMQKRFIYIVATAGVAVLLYFYLFGSRNNANNLISESQNYVLDSEHGHPHKIPGGTGLESPVVALHSPRVQQSFQYNGTYPLSAPLTSSKGLKYKIYIISDLDTDSKSKTDRDTWISYLKRGYLTYNPKDNAVSVEWAQEDLITLKSTISCGGRGMELSELVVFNGKLLTVDDRTGIVYEVTVPETGNRKFEPVPWVILPDGPGKESKGFKSEWATVKNQELYVGGLGKEWTSDKGELIHLNPQWIKIVSPTGEVRHIDWHSNYEKLKDSADIKTPGYMIHEAVSWSEIMRRWVFLPRRASKERYDADLDEKRGTNLLITASEDFTDIKVSHIGVVEPTHGFSSFKFVPDTGDKVIVALKSEENSGKVSSYIMAFDISGNVLLPETKIGDYKFEGIEFG